MQLNRSRCEFLAKALARQGCTLGNLVVLPADTVRLVQEVLTIAQGASCMLVDREHDRLHVVEAVAFTRTHVSYICERLNPGRMVRIGIVPIHRIRRSIGPMMALSVPGYFTRSHA
jgi:hypothetical protein